VTAYRVEAEKISLLSPGRGILTNKRAIKFREKEWGPEKEVSSG